MERDRRFQVSDNTLHVTLSYIYLFSEKCFRSSPNEVRIMGVVVISLLVAAVLTALATSDGAGLDFGSRQLSRRMRVR